MSDSHAPSRRVRVQRRLPYILIALTLILCVTALVYRGPLRARYWANRLLHADTPARRVTYLAALCNAGNDARWAVAALSAADDPTARQYAALIAQRNTAAWARRTLVAGLADADAGVRQLAAVGLAVQHDDKALPALRALYTTGDVEAAGAACLALQMLATPDAQRLLSDLTGVPADARKRAYLVDALRLTRTRPCAAALLNLLDDDRPCDAPPLEEALARAAAQVLGRPTSDTATLVTPRPRTSVAARAADALVFITGVNPGFEVTESPESRTKAVAAWRAALAATSQPTDSPQIP